MFSAQTRGKSQSLSTYWHTDMGETPAQNPHLISDLVPGVIEALSGKTNITPQTAAVWIKKTLLNLSESYPLPELERIGPIVTIGPGLGYNGSNYEYLISSFLQNASDDYTMMEDPVIFLNPTTAATPGLVNSGTANAGAVVGYSMDYMTPKAIQPLLFIPGGIPFKYTRYQNRFWFGTSPGQPYQTYLPYQLRHPFNDSNLLQSRLHITTSWEDIIEYGAAMRGAIANRWPDQMKTIHDLIYSDPISQGEPGLLKALMPQIARDERKSTRQLMPQVGRY
jgi:hypothetical protein